MKQPIQPTQFFTMSSFFLLFIILSSSKSFAFTPKNTEFSDFPIGEYEAHYTIKYFGIPAGDSIHRLKQREDGIYHFETKTNPLMDFIPYHYYESTDFTWESGKIVPQNYYYDIKEGKRIKKGNVAFDWEKRFVANQVSPKPWQKPITENLQDKLTQAIHLRYDLIQGNTELVYTVAEDDEIKPYAFRILGEEVVQTALGTFTAVKVEHVHRKGHRTNTWFAKNLNYLPIKINQIRKGRVVGQGEITKLNTPKKTQSFSQVKRNQPKDG